MGTSGSEGGPGKPTSRKADRAPRSDPYTYVSTWSGFAYVAFVTDAYARRMLGRRVAATMATSLVLDAIEQAIWTRQQEGVLDLKDVVHHTDRGSQPRFNGSLQHRLIESILDGR
jgi:transposase InsO family protein